MIGVWFIGLLPLISDHTLLRGDQTKGRSSFAWSRHLVQRKLLERANAQRRQLPGLQQQLGQEQRQQPPGLRPRESEQHDRARLVPVSLLSCQPGQRGEWATVLFVLRSLLSLRFWCRLRCCLPAVVRGQRITLWLRSQADFPSLIDHLQSTTPYLDLKNPISRPGCWAYPDQLEVGNFGGPKAFNESRSHFGAWCVVSSPLMLGFNVTDKALLDSVWPIISNKEGESVNHLILLLLHFVLAIHVCICN